MVRRTGAPRPLAVAALCVALLVGLAASRSDGEVILADTFTPGDGTGVVGGPLTGTSVETGNTVWLGSNGGQPFFDPPGVVKAARSSERVESVLQTPPNYNPLNQPVAVSARVNPIDTDSPVKWVGVGFVGDSTSPFWEQDVGQLWMLLRENGGFSVLARGDSIVLLLNDVPVPDWNAGGFNTLRLTYSPSGNTVTAKINATTVLQDYDLDSDSYTPNITQRVGLDFYANRGQADDFTLEVVPEPATVSLLSLGGALLVRRKRKRKGEKGVRDSP